jgi:hypothetical protein
MIPLRWGKILICFTLSSNDEMVMLGTRGRSPNPYSRFRVDFLVTRLGEPEQYNSRSSLSASAIITASCGGKKSSHGFAELHEVSEYV